MMDHDAAAAECGVGIVAVGCVELVVVDQAVAVTPDPDPELVLPAARLISINCRKHKVITTAAVDRAGAFVLCLPAA